MSGRMGDGVEGDCNMVYGLLSITLCHQGMKGGRDEERAI